MEGSIRLVRGLGFRVCVVLVNSQLLRVWGFRDGAKACGSGVTAVRGSEILGLGLTHTII